MKTKTMKERMKGDNEPMDIGHTEYDSGDLIHNHRTDDRFKISSVYYNPAMCDIVYKCSHYRYRFDMFEIPQSTITHAIDKGEMEIIEQ